MKLKICKPAFDFVKQINFFQSHEEKYLYFLSLLSWSKEFRNLSATYLKSSLGKNKGFNYRTIINYLTNEKVIECDGIRIYKKKSFGYKLTAKYYCADKQAYELTDKKLSNKIEFAALKKFETLPEWVKKQRENLSELTINGKYINPKLVKRARSGRISNIFTTTDKRIRDYLLYRDSEKLYELDFRNCQPYLLGVIVCNGMGFQSMDECLPEDLRLYLQLAEQGTVYEYFYDIIGKGSQAKFNRDKFKKSFFSGYFFNRKYNVLNNSKVGKIFKENFPTIHNYIIKNYINKNKTLAFALQVEEANLVINNIYKTLFDNNIWSATINDSVVCLERDKDIVRNIMEREIQRNIIPCFITETEWKGSIYHIQNGDKDSIKGDTTNRLYNRVTFQEVYTPPVDEAKPLNQNEERKKKTRSDILKAIAKLKSENIPISINQLYRVTGINKITIRKHLKEINRPGSPIPILGHKEKFEDWTKNISNHPEMPPQNRSGIEDIYFKAQKSIMKNEKFVELPYLTSKENIPATLSGDSQFLSSETTFSLDEMLEIITDDNWDESWLDCVAQHYPERLEAEIKAMKNMEKPI